MTEIEATMDEIRDILAKDIGLGSAANNIGDDVSLIGGAGFLDSVAVAELITALEERFRMSLGPEELDVGRFANLRSLAQLVLAMTHQNVQKTSLRIGADAVRTT